MRKFISSGFRGFLTSLVVALLIATHANAQDIDVTDLTAKAEAGDKVAQRELGAALIYGFGGVSQDTQAGKRLLEQAVTGGDIAAKASLGKLLIDGTYLEGEPDRGFDLLEEAAAAGNTQALTSLGIARLWGLDIEADPVEARSLLEAAALNGGVEASRVLGEGLIGGWVFDRDVEAGLPMLEQAVDAGDTKAKIALGSFLLYGDFLDRDLGRATALFEDAAKDGNGEGLENLGAFLMWNEGNARAGETYLRRAGEMGRGSAWVTLAEGAMYGYLGAGSRRKFDEFAESAREAEAPRIEVLDAVRQMWGISMRASGPKTIAKLEQATEQGNVVALKYLISLVRDGNQLNIRKQPERAKNYLERFSGLLTPTEIAQFVLSIDAAKTKNVSDYLALSERFSAHDEHASEWFGKELYAANPNFAIYLLQAEMKRRGRYSGRLNGLATRLTLRAIWQECQSLKDNRRCSDTVMHPDVIGALLAL